MRVVLLCVLLPVLTWAHSSLHKSPFDDGESQTLRQRHGERFRAHQKPHHTTHVYSHVNTKERKYSLCESERTGELYYYKQRSYDQVSMCEKELARAVISNEINQTGWAFLEVETFDEEIPMWKQGYAAGFVEGRATRDLIRMHIINTVDGYCDGAKEYCGKLSSFLLENLRWQQEQIEANEDDLYWQQVNMTLNQLQGIIAGYEENLGGYLSNDDLVIHPIFMIQLAGDVEDLALRFNRPEGLRSAWKGGHCSALVRLLDDHSDIMFSHVTWSSYSTMLRMQKKYNFKLCKCKNPGHSYTFSSYPGAIPSTDDFMISSSGLSIMETTISNYNRDIMNKYITPQTVLCWVRAQVATRMANSTDSWAEIFALQNSGTYNNQWIIVDYKKFKAGAPGETKKGLLHILEQMPGYIMHKDLTEHVLESRFWPSYNMPYFPEIYNDSMTADFAMKYGDWFTYDKTPRALIFGRDATKVKDMQTMRALMRSNDYTHDEFAKCDCTPPYSAENAISCRSDLNPADGVYPFDSLGHRDHGATDMKLTNSQLQKTLQFEAISGPTHDPVPVFDWRTTPYKNLPHAGQPNRWTFKPVRHEWNKNGLYRTV